MTLPDWTVAIQTQLNAFMAWDSVETVVAAVVGIAIGSVVLAMFMRVFVRA